MEKKSSDQFVQIQIDSMAFAWLEMLRSHSYISFVILQEGISDLYDAKNPLMIQEILMDLWSEQFKNQVNLYYGLSDIGMVFFRRSNVMPFGILEEEVYGILS